jgi:hypothetical protein
MAAASLLPHLLVLALLVTSWVLMAELIQGLQVGWSKPWAITYVIHGGYAINLIVYALLRLVRHCRRRGESPASPSPSACAALVHPSCGRLALAAFLLQLLAAVVAMTWYISLPDTTVAGNNAVYQSASAWVLVLQLLFYPRGGGEPPPDDEEKEEGEEEDGEEGQEALLIEEGAPLDVDRPSRSDSSSSSSSSRLAVQIIAITVCLAGVMLVTFAPPSTTDGADPSTSPQPRQTVSGYLWVLASTVLYASYEVLYGAWVTRIADPPHTDDEGRTARGRGSRSDESRVGRWARRARRRCRRLARRARGGGQRAGARPDNDDDEDDDDGASASDPLLGEEAFGTGSEPGKPASSPTGGKADGGADDEQTSADGQTVFSVASDPRPGGRGAAGGAAGLGLGDGGRGLAAGARRRRRPNPLDQAEVAALVLGLMGAFTLVTLLPVFPLLDATGIEPFEWPSPEKARLLALNTGLDSVYNLSLLLGISLSSPLSMSVATMLVVPASLLADWALHGLVPGVQAGCGMAVILVGFATLHLPWRRICRGRRG